MRNLIGVAFALVLLLTTPIYAQQRGVRIASSSSERRVALVIGNSAYEVAPLKNPANDARDIAQALTDLGFEVIHRENLNQNDMKRAIREFGSKIRNGGVGLFYYAGHGVQVRGVNYLVPVGAKVESEEEVEYESVDASFVLAQMESAGNSMNIVILDACRNNPFARSFRSTSRGLAQMDTPSGTLIAYATAPNSVASDGSGRNGIYTQELLRFIRTPNLSIEDVFKQVRISVRNLTQGQQTPWESSSLTGNFSFVGATITKGDASLINPPLTQSVEFPQLSKKQDALPAAPQKNSAADKQRVTLNGISFELQSCKAAGTTVSCTLSVTNDSAADINLYTLKDSQMITESGEVFKVSSWQVGAASGGGWNSYIRTVLVSGVATKAIFKFDRVGSNVNKLSLLRISFSFNVFGGEVLNADFRNIILNP